MWWGKYNIKSLIKCDAWVRVSCGHETSYFLFIFGQYETSNFWNKQYSHSLQVKIDDASSMPSSNSFAYTPVPRENIICCNRTRMTWQVPPGATWLMDMMLLAGPHVEPTLFYLLPAAATINHFCIYGLLLNPKSPEREREINPSLKS